VDTKRAKFLFFSSKRFKFEQIDQNGFRLGGRQYGQLQSLFKKLSKLNLRSQVPVKENQNLLILFFLKDNVFSYPKQVRI